MTVLTNAQRTAQNAVKFRRDFAILDSAGVGVIVTRTREPDRCIRTLKEFAFGQPDGQHLDFRTWNAVHGWSRYDRRNPDQPPTRDNLVEPLAAMKLIDGLAPNGQAVEPFGDGIYMMHYLHYYLPRSPQAPQMIALIKDYARTFVEGRRRLVLVMPMGFTVPNEIEDDVVILDFDPPAYAEVAESFDMLMESLPDPRKRPNFSRDDKDRLVSAAMGLTAHEAETAFSRALIVNGSKLPQVTADDIAREVMAVKVEAVKKSEVLEVMPTENMNNVGGLEALKHWVAQRRNCFSDEARAFGIEAPKGIFLGGPPGTGKSLVAKAIAHGLGQPLIKFDVGRVFAGLVGESEARVRSALKLIEAMAPCTMLLDEADKALGGIQNGGGDSGVSKRVLGAILTWMQEKTAPVFVVATANRVAQLPSEFTRRGRFDEVFSVSLPTEAERMAILQIHLRKRGHTNVQNLEAAVAKEGYVPAEIEAAVKDALVEAFNNNEPVTGELIARQFEHIVPLSEAFKEDFQAMKDWADANARPANGPAPARGEASRPRALARPRPVSGTRRLAGLDG